MPVLYAVLLSLLCLPLFALENEEQFRLCRLKYSGGGDWYVGPTTVPNWSQALNKELFLNADAGLTVVSPEQEALFGCSVLFATGHGNISFKNPVEAENLRRYLLQGGLLFINDSYGMDIYLRQNLPLLFEDKKLLPLAASHPVYSCFHKLDGLPKIHEHDGKPAQGYALMDGDRIMVFYAFSSDIGDGLEDQGVHKNDTPELRQLASQMAVNLVYYHLNP